MKVILQITRADDLWMARSEAIQGLLVTGETLDDLFSELPRVAQALYEVCVEKGWQFVKGSPRTRLSDIEQIRIWSGFKTFEVSE